MDGNNDNILNISLNDKNKTIRLGDKRYKNKVQNLAITKIITDKNDDIQFLEIDGNLFKNDLETNYNNKSIYILKNYNKKDISISFGKIKGIINEKINYSSNFNFDFQIIYQFLI